MDEAEELIGRLERVAFKAEEVTRHGNLFYGNSSHIALFREAAKALTVPPEKLEAAARAMAFGRWDDLPDFHHNRLRKEARAAAIALGLKVEG